jgi:hypothetical protein
MTGIFFLVTAVQYPSEKFWVPAAAGVVCLFIGFI